MYTLIYLFHEGCDVGALYFLMSMRKRVASCNSQKFVFFVCVVFMLLYTLNVLVPNIFGGDFANMNESGADGKHQGAANEFQLISEGRCEA